MRVSTISLRLTFISDAGQPFWQHEKKSNERLLLSVACSTNFKPDATTAMGYTLPYFSQFAVSNTLTTDSAYEVWVIASGGPDWGGCQVWISIDNATYALAGMIYRGARQGPLTAELPSHPDPDDISTLSVDLTQS